VSHWILYRMGWMRSRTRLIKELTSELRFENVTCEEGTRRSDFPSYSRSSSMKNEVIFCNVHDQSEYLPESLDAILPLSAREQKMPRREDSNDP